MSIPQSGKAGIPSFTVKGIQIAAMVPRLQVFESVCKQYLTATAHVIDDTNFIDGNQIVGGEDVTFTVLADGGQMYSQDMVVYSVKKEQANKSHRALAYQLELIGKEFLGDRTQIVKQSFQNITGTDIIKKLHEQYVGGSALKVLSDSMGLLFKNAHIFNGDKPFKAIEDMRRLITFGSYPTGSTAMFRDRENTVLAPVEQLLTQSADNVTYVQKSTWGANFLDIALSTDAIIDLKTSIDGHEGNRTNIHHILAARKQEFNALDIKSGKPLFNILAQILPDLRLLGVPFGALSTIDRLFASSRHGGRPQNIKVDSDKTPATAVRRTDKEQQLKAMVAGGPQIYIKVPIQGGLKTTVGKVVNLKVLPPVGIQEETNDSMLSGPALVADIAHDFLNNNDLSSSSLRLVKGGYFS